jgi:hypothetical protein
MLINIKKSLQLNRGKKGINMIEQWETNFPENNASKRMADERYTLLNSLRKEFCHSQEFKLSTIIQNEIDDDEVIYFDLINENPSSELVKSKIQEKVAENFQETHPDKNLLFLHWTNLCQLNRCRFPL